MQICAFERAYKLGLVKQDRYEHLLNQIIDFAKTFSIKAALINDALESLGTARLTHGCKLIVLNRPQITIENIAATFRLSKPSGPNYRP